MCVIKARTYFRCSSLGELPALSANIRQGWSGSYLDILDTELLSKRQNRLDLEADYDRRAPLVTADLQVVHLAFENPEKASNYSSYWHSYIHP
jgi:hypothetical protein